MPHKQIKGIKIQTNSENKLAELIDLAQLENIQDLFAEVINAPIQVVNIQGTSLTHISRKASACEIIHTRSLFGAEHCLSCIRNGIKCFFDNQQEVHECVFGLKHYFIPVILSDGEVVGFIVIGPVLIGRRSLPGEFDDDVLQSLGVDRDELLDVLRDVTIISYRGMESIHTLIRDTLQYMIELSVHKKKLQECIPGFIVSQDAQAVSSYKTLYKNKLLNVLMDISLAFLDPDTISIFLYEQEDRKLHLKIAHGLPERFVRDHTIELTQGIVGHVFRSGKSLLLEKQESDEPMIRRCLIRKEVSRSMVVPIKAYDDIFGVACMTSFTEKQTFNKSNLHLLSKLCELSGVAVASFQL